MESIHTGDKITLFLEGVGYMGMGPIRAGTFNQSRFYTSVIPSSSIDGVPPNFSNLCVFSIEILSDFQTMEESSKS